MLRTLRTAVFFLGGRFSESVDRFPLFTPLDEVFSESELLESLPDDDDDELEDDELLLLEESDDVGAP